jgi:hypothetical protein
MSMLQRPPPPFPPPFLPPSPPNPPLPPPLPPYPPPTPTAPLIPMPFDDIKALAFPDLPDLLLMLMVPTALAGILAIARLARSKHIDSFAHLSSSYDKPSARPVSVGRAREGDELRLAWLHFCALRH